MIILIGIAAGCVGAACVWGFLWLADSPYQPRFLLPFYAGLACGAIMFLGVFVSSILEGSLNPFGGVE